MARRTALEEARIHIERFFTETKAGLMQDIMKTRVKTRRANLLAEVDVFDKVEGRAYDWFTSQGVNDE